MADNVGNNTYGHNTMNIRRWDSDVNPRCNVNIGKFCSIADDITVLTNGNHKYNRVTTYPFSELNWIPITKENASACGKGDINIGNDVWIGHKSFIHSGITIGDGAVIAACSNITKDVPPYSLVGGNPAKVIKYRFDIETIQSLLQIKWWDWPQEKIRETLPFLLKDDGCKSFIEKILDS